MRTPLAVLPFVQAAEEWLESRRNFLAEKTFHRYQFYLKELKKGFPGVQLGDITGEMIRDYQKKRSATISEKTGLPIDPSTINHEVSLLEQMLKRIGRWPQIAYDYQPLPLRKIEHGRALSDQEYVRLFRVAGAKPEWEGCFSFAMIAITTTCNPGEVLGLRLGDIDLVARTISITHDSAKNPERVRTIPLNEEGWKAVKAALERAERLGACRPGHYLFPFRIQKSHWDPTRHCQSFRRAWEKICAEAGVANFRMEDLRHTAISRLLENAQISEQTAEAIAGHVSAKMKKRYSHIRMQFKRKAVEALRPPWKKSA